MSKLTKNQKTAEEKVDFGKQYRLLEACRLVKETNYAKFDASVDLAVRLGVDPRKANQMTHPWTSLYVSVSTPVRPTRWYVAL